MPINRSRASSASETTTGAGTPARADSHWRSADPSASRAAAAASLASESDIPASESRMANASIADCRPVALAANSMWSFMLAARSSRRAASDSRARLRSSQPRRMRRPLIPSSRLATAATWRSALSSTSAFAAIRASVSGVSASPNSARRRSRARAASRSGPSRSRSCSALRRVSAA